MFYYVLRYNLGSMAFGSLILAVVEVLVWFLEVLDEQTKADQQSNPVMRLVLKCCKVSPIISLYLPISPLYLPVMSLVLKCCKVSPIISLYLPLSPLYLPVMSLVLKCCKVRLHLNPNTNPNPNT